MVSIVTNCHQGFQAALWFGLNVALPLMPLFAAWGLQALRRAKFSFRSVIKDGQLCFYPIAIMGVAAFDYAPALVNSIKANDFSKQLGMMIAMAIIMLLSIFAYAIFLVDHLSSRNEISDVKTRNISLLLTSSSVVLTYLSHIC